MKALRLRTIVLCVLAAAVLCAAAAGADLYKKGMLHMPIPEEDALPILMYHHLVADGEECNDMTVTVGRMEKDLKWLQDNGYHTVLPRELAAGDPLPEKPVLLTFDDGYRSNYELLFPLLEKYQMKAVISIITYMQDVSASNFISWDMCREMTESGLVEIGSTLTTSTTWETWAAISYPTESTVSSGTRRRPTRSFKSGCWTIFKKAMI